MSHAGREVLIKSSLAEILTFQMGIRLFPKATCNKMEGIMRNFYWEYSAGSRHLFLESWAHLQKAKAIGRVGFRHITAANESLFLKLGWRLIKSPIALWV